MNKKIQIQSLWGELSLVDNIRSPHIILKEQASILTELTNGLLVGNVIKSLHKNHEEYQNTSILEIKVPSLNNYSIEVLQIDYNFDFYPLLIASDIISVGLFRVGKNKECFSEDDFNKALEQVLSSTGVKRIIGTLLQEIER